MRCQTCGCEIDEFVLACPQCGRNPTVRRPGPPDPADEPDARTPARRVQYGPNRRARVIVSGVIALCALALLGFFILNYFIQAGKNSVKVTCVTNQRVIDEAISSYYVEQGRWPSSMADLRRYLKQEPFCPLGTTHYLLVCPSAGSMPHVRCPNSDAHKP